MANKRSSNGGFKMMFYKSIMPKIYGIGASIVIAGAMFKLLNWPGGALMLGLGLTTEAIIFFLSSFEPKEKELDWTKAYPELLENGERSTPASNRPQGPVGEKLESLFTQAKIDSALIEKLGKGMRHLSESVANLAAIPDLSATTAKYVANVEKVSAALENMYEAQSGSLETIHGLAESSQKIQAYHEQIQMATETLNALNLTYKKEMQEVDSRSQTTKEVHMHIADSIEKMQKASEEAEKFKVELAQLSEKLASLNNIYGNMLSALKS